jgi:hypothetical protein
MCNSLFCSLYFLQNISFAKSVWIAADQNKLNSSKIYILFICFYPLVALQVITPGILILSVRIEIQIEITGQRHQKTVSSFAPSININNSLIWESVAQILPYLMFLLHSRASTLLAWLFIYFSAVAFISSTRVLFGSLNYREFRVLSRLSIVGFFFLSEASRVLLPH